MTHAAQAGVPDDPLVSVVIIFFNAERFLPEAVESVRAQTWGRWELLLVDDGSTDASTGMARGYASADSGRVRYLEHEGHANRGMSASRNLGVSGAEGEWIAFLDSDDVWLPNKLSDQIALTRAYPRAEFVCGASLAWFSWDPDATETDRVIGIGVDETRLVEPPGLATQWLTRHNKPSTGSELIGRTTYERLGGYEDAFRGLFEDQAFYLKASLHVPILATPTVFMRYRQHDGSSCSVFDRMQLPAARRRFMQWALGYISRSSVDDPAALASALRQGLFEAALFKRAYEQRLSK